MNRELNTMQEWGFPSSFLDKRQGCKMSPTRLPKRITSTQEAVPSCMHHSQAAVAPTTARTHMVAAFSSSALCAASSNSTKPGKATGSQMAMPAAMHQGPALLLLLLVLLVKELQQVNRRSNSSVSVSRAALWGWNCRRAIVENKSVIVHVSSATCCVVMGARTPQQANCLLAACMASAYLLCAGTDLQCSWLGKAVSVEWNDTARMLLSHSLKTMERMTSCGPAFR